MRYFIILVLLSGSAMAGDYDYIKDSPFIYQPPEAPPPVVYNPQPEPGPVYIPVQAPEPPPSPLGEGSLKPGW